jgi:hypothetical protein
MAAKRLSRLLAVGTLASATRWRNERPESNLLRHMSSIARADRIAYSLAHSSRARRSGRTIGIASRTVT